MCCCVLRVVSLCVLLCAEGGVTACATACAKTSVADCATDEEIAKSELRQRPGFDWRGRSTADR